MEQLWIAGTALLLGALHAMEPGHSKTVIAAYVAGAQDNQRRALASALVLGCSVALSHTFTIIALALLAQFALASVTGEAAHQWLQGASAALTLLLGGILFYQARRKPAHVHHEHCCEHHTNEKTTKRANSYAMLSLIGVGGGLVPCPSALAALLSAGASGQLARGVWVVVLFSCGIALTLVLVSLLACQAQKQWRSRWSFARWARWEPHFPLLTAAIITLIGLISLAKLILNLA